MEEESSLPVEASKQRLVPPSPTVLALRATRLAHLSPSGAMASTFEGVVKRVIRELDHGGKLIPVDSLQSSAGFQPYCLLRRKLPMSRFQKVRYTGINLSIRDILEPGAPEPGTPSAGRGRTGGLLPVPRL